MCFKKLPSYIPVSLSILVAFDVPYWSKQIAVQLQDHLESLNENNDVETVTSNLTLQIQIERKKKKADSLKI